MSDGDEKTYLLDHLGWREVPLSSRVRPVCAGCLWQRIRAWTESIMAGTPASVNGREDSYTNPAYAPTGRGRASFPLDQVLGSHEGHIKWPSARAESTENSPCPSRPELRCLCCESSCPLAGAPHA